DACSSFLLKFNSNRQARLFLSSLHRRLATMPSQPRIHLVRHAQGFHNLGNEFHSLPDPRLTPLGESQCAKLQEEHFPAERQQSLSLITASPLTRTLHTAFLTFKPALTSADAKCKSTIFAIPDAQE